MEFQQNPFGWSLSHFGFPFHGISNGIQQNPPESFGIREPPGMVSIGIRWNLLESIEIPIFWGIPTDSNGFQCLPLLVLYNIKKVHEQGLNHGLSKCHVHRKQQYIH